MYAGKERNAQPLLAADDEATNGKYRVLVNRVDT